MFFHENEPEYCESELGNSGAYCSGKDTHKNVLPCDFGGKWSDTTHIALMRLIKAVVAPLTGGVMSRFQENARPITEHQHNVM